MALSDVLVVAVAFVAMEAFSYSAHRWMMHGPVGMRLHRSHHVPGWSRFEANDWFPVSFAGVTVLAMSLGVSFPSLRGVFVAGIGVTMYGASYVFVHDIYIHARLGHLPALPVLERLKDAHLIHHLFSGEPFGMLFPVVPRVVRARAAAASHRSVRVSGG